MLQLRVQHIEQFCLFDLFWGQGQRLSVQIPFPHDLINLYQQWRRIYLNYYQTLSVEQPENTDNTLRGKSASSGTIITPTTDWHSRLTQIETQLLYEFQHWLRSDKLYEIRATVSQFCQAQPDAKSIDLMIACSSVELARFPWEIWEIGTEFGTTGRIRITRMPTNIRAEFTPVHSQRSRARILAIIGQDRRLDFQKDLEALQAKLKSLVTVETVGWKPGKLVSELETEIKQAITDDKGWDILFFAGHSNETHITGGELGIAPNRYLQIKDIAYQLEIAKNRGLQFAFFNSCNGLSIAEALIDLGLSQVAVMREPIYNQVAQEFLLEFLQNLAQYKDVQECLVSTCKFLKLEKSFTYPSAYLIPSLFHYPNTEWFQLKPSGWKHFFKQLFRPKPYEIIALATLSILSLLPSVQYQLLDQRVRVQAIYRNKTGQVPNHSPAILLVEIDNASLEEAGLIKPKPISRQYLARLIDRTAQLNFDIVGVDYLLNIDWPEEDPALEKSLAASRSQSGTQYIFITSRDSGNERRLARPQFADPNWQGDSRLWENGRYMTLLPLETEERPFPFSYLLALADTAEDSQSLSQTNPILLIEQLFATWMRPILLTRHSYRHYQYWLHPIVDFSIPQNTIYESISAKDFLAATPEQLQKKYLQPVMMIIPGGYAEAGINDSGEDNFPPPPAFCYWQRQAQPHRPCRIILGGEIHAYLFYHFLKKSAVVPIPDLWLLWLFALIGKGATVLIEQSEFYHRKVFVAFSGGTIVYGIVSLQLYISGLVLLPILIPIAIFWIYLILQLKLRKFQ